MPSAWTLGIKHLSTLKGFQHPFSAQRAILHSKHLNTNLASITASNTLTPNQDYKYFFQGSFSSFPLSLVPYNSLLYVFLFSCTFLGFVLVQSNLIGVL